MEPSGGGDGGGAEEAIESSGIGWGGRTTCARSGMGRGEIDVDPRETCGDCDGEGRGDRAE